MWGVVNSYGVSNNNGNLLSQGISAKGMTAAVNQFFVYDALNRVTMGTENPSSSSSPACPDSGSQWCEQFSYDIYGNRTMAQTSFTGLVTPQGFSAATNQITDSGWSYDGSGNVNHDPTLGVSYKYDAENRLVAACGSDAVSTCTNQAGAGRTLYGYDGEGRRVTKQTASGVMTTYVYDAEGQLAAEYGDPAGGGTEYLTADHLGSTRVVTNASATVVARHDFRPFGDEVTGTAARSGVVGYGTDGAVAQKFTGKERDAETGLDYFGARYFSSVQGRWTSPDAPFADQHLAEPQSWNLYGYVRENPLKYFDPNGRDAQQTFNASEMASIQRDMEFAAEHPALTAGAIVGAVGTAGGVTEAGGVFAAARTLFNIMVGCGLSPSCQQTVVESLAPPGTPSGSLGSLELSASSRLNQAEVATGERFAQQEGLHLMESPHVGSDVVDKATGQAFDFVGTAQGYASKNFSLTKFEGSIERHLLKSDNITVIDLTGASKEQKAAIQGYVSNLSDAQKAKIQFTGK